MPLSISKLSRSGGRMTVIPANDPRLDALEGEEDDEG